MRSFAALARGLGAFVTLIGLLPADVALSVDNRQDTIFYVSTQGNDSWSGTLASPNAQGTDGPFATVARAQRAVREVRSRQDVPVSVLIRGGLYVLDEPLVFGHDDAGSAQSPVTYAAFPGERPALSGGSSIRGWQRRDGPIWTAKVPKAENDEWYFRQLFVNGERQIRARTPNEGYLYTEGPLQPLLDRERAQRDRESKIGFRYQGNDLQKWADIGEANIFLYHSWTCSLHWIDSLDEANHTVRFVNQCGWPVGYWDLHQRYHVENYLEALDSPGEWYLDRSTGTLHYWPPDGQDPNQMEIIAPRLQHLLILQGDLDRGLTVDSLILRGLSLQHADWVVDGTGEVDGQAATFLSAAVVATGARNCVLEDCEIAHVGEYGVILGEGCKNNHIVHCEIHDLGAGGVRLGQTHLPGEAERQAESNRVDNCFIHDGGHVFRAGIGVWIGRSSYNTVSHNEICDFFYSGCSVGWSWGYAASTAHDNVLEYNHIHNIGKGVLSDMGGIYTLGISPGTVERFNIIHDIHSYSYGGWGLYTDEGSTNITLENNIVYNTKSGSFHQHYGRENLLRNNVLGPALEATIIRSREEEHISFTLQHNIIITSNGHVLGSTWSNGNYRMDHNLYWDTSNILGEDMDFAGRNFQRWQATGHDEHSIVADPMFTNAEQHDYALQNGSPALSIGFQPIDVQTVGLYGEPEWVEAPGKIVRTPLPQYLPPDLVHAGPVTYPENLSQDGRWIIKYDPTRGTGTIPVNTQECTFVWTVDSGRVPNKRPPGSQVVDGSCQSPMKKGLDGVWYVLLSRQTADALCFRFRDGMLGSNWDDNQGRNWWITSREYVSEVLSELGRVIEQGSNFGADMSSYAACLSRATTHYLQAGYGDAMNEIGANLGAAGLAYAEQLLRVTSRELDSIRAEGVDLSLDDRLLYLAGIMIREGAYRSAEAYCLTVLVDVSNRRAGISEAIGLLGFFTAALRLFHMNGLAKGN